MPRQIYPTLLVTSLALAVVVCLHPSIAEEFLALVGIDLPGGMRHQVQADESLYGSIPTIPSARYGTVPAPPVEPTSGVRPAGWPAPANVEVSGAGAIPAVEEPAQYPPGSYGATGAAAYPSTSSAVYPGTSYPGSSYPSPAPTYAGADAGAPSGYAPPISNTRPPAAGAVSQTHAPEAPQGERRFYTQGNPYRRWDAPVQKSERVYSSWGRETIDTPAPYQQWNPPVTVADTHSAAVGPQGTNRSARAPMSQSGTPYAAGGPSAAPVVTSQPTSQLVAQPPRYGSQAPYQNTAAPPAASRYPSTAASPSQAAAGAIDSIPRYAQTGEGAPVLPPPPTAPGNPPVNPIRPAVPNTAAAPWPQRDTQPAAAPPPEAAGSAPEPFEGAEILARVGSEPILCSEVIAPVNEIINKHRDEIPESDIPKYKRMFLKKHLQSVINTKLIYLDATRKIPKEALPGIRDQLADFFYSHQLPEMMKVAKVETRDEFDDYLQALGSSLQRERDAAIENLLAQQWMHEQAGVESKVTHEQMLTYYHDHLDEFSFPAKGAMAAVDRPYLRLPLPPRCVRRHRTNGKPRHGRGSVRAGWRRTQTLQGSDRRQGRAPRLDYPGKPGLGEARPGPLRPSRSAPSVRCSRTRTRCRSSVFSSGTMRVEKRLSTLRSTSARRSRTSGRTKPSASILPSSAGETRITTVFDNDPTGPVVAQEPGTHDALQVLRIVK